jgi:hypothetical protein
MTNLEAFVNDLDELYEDIKTNYNNIFINLSKDKHPDIKFIMLIEDTIKVENCMKVFANKYKLRGNQELYKINLDTLKNIVFDCAILNDTIIIYINK